jgi:hypothetical protein
VIGVVATGAAASVLFLALRRKKIE